MGWQCLVNINGTPSVGWMSNFFRDAVQSAGWCRPGWPLAQPRQLTIAKQALEQALQASAHRTQWSCW